MSNFQTIEKQKRWSAAFDAGMQRSDVEKILRIEPFRSMNPNVFPAGISLFDILLYESKILRLNRDEIILRQGEYGSSAFLLLSGSVTLISNLEQNRLGRSRTKKKSWYSIVSQLWNQSKLPEIRKLQNYELKQDKAYENLTSSREKLPSDILENLEKYEAEVVTGNIFFSEGAAISRTPHIHTAIANERTDVLELKWQGLRELMRYDENLRHRLVKLYKANNLKDFLKKMPALASLSDLDIELFIEHSQLQSYGEEDWYSGFSALEDTTEDMAAISREAVIVEEKTYIDNILIVTSGFARVCQRAGQGFVTLGFLRPGDIFGLELFSQSDIGDQGYSQSLHALGNTDVLSIPAAVFRKSSLDSRSFAQNYQKKQFSWQHKASQHSDNLLTHMISRRFINGTKAMIIDLDRCTGCDDCVTACSNAHDNNPRFIRQGVAFEKFMVANACMHCYDPVCLIGCPTGAIFRHPQGGEIIINDQTCVGCATCANSCPYHNIRMVNIRSEDGALLMDKQFTPIVKATKCDFCVDQRVSPACVNACPHDAMRRIDFHNLKPNKNWLGL